MCKICTCAKSAHVGTLADPLRTALEEALLGVVGDSGASASAIREYSGLVCLSLLSFLIFVFVVLVVYRYERSRVRFEASAEGSVIGSLHTEPTSGSVFEIAEYMKGARRIISPSVKGQVQVGGLSRGSGLRHNSDQRVSFRRFDVLVFRNIPFCGISGHAILDVEWWKNCLSWSKTAFPRWLIHRESYVPFNNLRGATAAIYQPQMYFNWRNLLVHFFWNVQERNTANAQSWPMLTDESLLKYKRLKKRCYRQKACKYGNQYGGPCGEATFGNDNSGRNVTKPSVIDVGIAVAMFNGGLCCWLIWVRRLWLAWVVLIFGCTLGYGLLVLGGSSELEAEPRQ